MFKKKNLGILKKEDKQTKKNNSFEKKKTIKRNLELFEKKKIIKNKNFKNFLFCK